MGRGGWIAAHLRVGCRCIWVTTMTIKRRWRTIQRRWGAVSSCGGSELVVAGVMTSLRFLWSPIARICFHVIWRVLKLNLAWHHRRGQWKLFVNFVEVGLSFRVREQLSLIRLHPLHHSYQMWETPKETFVVKRAEVISGPMETFESPPTTLAREGFKFSVGKVLGYHLTNKELPVVDLPRPTMRLQMIRKRTQYRVRLLMRRAKMIMTM
jgi:hypothetical protein